MANQPPEARFTLLESQGSAPLRVSFDASEAHDPDGELVEYSWDFGDGKSGSGVQAEHVYGTPGEYLPSLEVTDDRGSKDSAVAGPVRVRSPPGVGQGIISGDVWHDVVGDGVRSPDAAGLGGFVVYLDLDGNGSLGAGEPLAFTQENGGFEFTGVETATPARVRLELPFGWTPTAAHQVVEVSAQAPALVIPPPSFIIGGQIVEEEAYPFMVTLVARGVSGNRNAFFCGGTLVAARWVLTAAHCVDGLGPQEFQVLVGTQNLDDGGRRVSVANARIFPAYGDRSFVGNDVAVVQLEEALMVRRMPLQTPARPGLSEPSTPARAIGWGRTSLGGAISPLLRQVDLPLISNAECRIMLGESVVVTTICAGTQGTTQSICNGDSGGPLMVRDGEGWVQVGLTSFGVNCQPPMAFARVAPFMDWLRLRIPPEPSLEVLVDWGGGITAEVEFGNFR